MPKNPGSGDGARHGKHGDVQRFVRNCENDLGDLWREESSADCAERCCTSEWRHRIGALRVGKIRNKRQTFGRPYFLKFKNRILKPFDHSNYSNFTFLRPYGCLDMGDMPKLRIPVKRRARSGGTVRPFRRKRRETPPVGSERPAAAIPHRVEAAGLLRKPSKEAYLTASLMLRNL